MRNKLEKWRERSNIDAQNVYKKIGISSSEYTRWEKGDRKINMKGIVKLTNYFGINIDYLLNLSDDIEVSNIKYTDDKVKIGKRLKEIRDELNLSLREENKLIDVSINALSRYERGVRLITPEALYKLCKNTGYDANWIMSEVNIIKKKKDK